MKIGTLSSAIDNDQMSLSSDERIAIIETAARDSSPDILLAAGYSLQTADDMEPLAERLSALNWDGLLVAEVMDYQGDLPRLVEIGGTRCDLSGHCVVVWSRANGWHVLGRQFFTQSAQVKAGKKTIVKLFEETLKDRVVEFRGHKIGVLICGELNAVQGRDNVTALTPEIGNWLDGLDIILNPTHDRMGNGGTLNAKRKWLSSPQNDHPRIYVSSSNWNTHKPWKNAKGFITQSRSTDTLHTVFCGGENVAQKNHPYENFEYREAILND
ncbi:MAG: hypothetical protein COC12_01640 [Rhodobacteraceae bacterium]|nr:MAG: hypothetical protein COC12_01640 [Paracoccaceae bacterium]